MTKEETWERLVALNIVKGLPPEGLWNFSNAQLTNTYLVEADFSECDLSGANLSRANLSRANLSRANLRDAFLIHANLSGAGLADADLFGAFLLGADLIGTNLAGGHLTVANFITANLSGANLSETYLLRANLSRANLNGADISGANLSGANLTDANLRDANLRDANLSDANLSGASLTDATLVDANLSRANLSGTNLSGASLACSILLTANLTKAVLNGACIDDANLSDWIIKDVICTNIVRKKSGSVRIVSFAPLEFEKRYTQLGRIVELILTIPCSASIGFIANTVASSINHIKGSTVVSWKGVEALSDNDTRITFNVWDNDFWDKQRETFETAFKDTLNEYFENKTLLPDAPAYTLDVISQASGGVIEVKDKVDIPYTPLIVNTKVLGEKALDFFLKTGKIGEDILAIVRRTFQ